MNIEQAKILINEEFNSKNGLNVLFRLSQDIDDKRISFFLEALRSIEKNYRNEIYIERDLVYKLFNFHQTLQASQNHWKNDRPKGLTYEICFEIFTTIGNVFAD